jgi:hypothetical protein
MLSALYDIQPKDKKQQQQLCDIGVSQFITQFILIILSWVCRERGESKHNLVVGIRMSRKRQARDKHTALNTRPMEGIFYSADAKVRPISM